MKYKKVHITLLIVFASSVLVSANSGSSSKEISISYGDYFNGFGEHIGTDSLSDGKIYIAEKWKSLIVKNALKEGGRENILIARSSSYEIPSIKILYECLDVLKRTKANGGLREEVSVLFTDGKITRGKTGPKPIFSQNVMIQEVSIPAFPDKKQDSDVEVVIHSHAIGSVIDIDRLYSISAFEKSKADQVTFHRFKMNIIVGHLGNAVINPNGNTVHDKPLGIVIYYRKTWSEVGIRFSAINRIIDYLQEDMVTVR